MAGVKVISTGLSGLIKDMQGYVADLNREVSIAGTNAGEEVVRYARNNHRFTRDSGDLEESVTFEYSLEPGNVHTFDIYLDGKFTTVSDGRSYGVFIHEGTYQGYSQSPIAPFYNSSISKSGKGWQADPFLWVAIDKKWDIEKRIQKGMKRLKRKYERV